MPASQAAQNLQTMIHTQFGGLNLSAGPTAIADSEFLALQNLMPYANGNLAVVPAPSLLSAPPTGKSIHAIWCQTLANVPYLLTQMTDGSLYSYLQSTNTWTLIVTGTTVNGLSVTKFQGTDASGNPEAVLFADTTLGYASWTAPNTWTVIDATKTGQAICVYSGRVWIAIRQEIVFTSPDGYKDFTLTNGAGFFTPTDPSMSTPPIQLLVAQNWLYILGSSIMALNNVQITQVGNTTNSVTTFFVTLVSSSVGITTPKAAMVYDNTLIVVTNIGVYVYYGLTERKISQNMGDNFSGSFTISACTIFGKTVLFLDNGYCFQIEDNRWFNVDFALVPTWISQDTQIFGGVSGYVATAAGLFQFADNFTLATPCFVHTKLFDAGNASINKQVTKMGFEFFQNELLNPPNVSPVVSIAYQADGFLTSSAKFTHNNMNGTKNTFVRDTINLIDRYFSMGITFTAPAGTSISAFFWQFQGSTSWP
ncbi:MAG: hypothetical protein ACYDCJ_12925 [Gammaproteobacteria bacterium]